MSVTLIERLEAAKAEYRRLKREIAGATCAEIGHRWKFIGGRNCGCDADQGWCSLPVHECTVCRDCDYGEGDEAQKIRAACQYDAALSAPGREGT